MSVMYVQALLVLVKSKVKTYVRQLSRSFNSIKTIRFSFNKVMQTSESYVKVSTPV